MIDWDSPLSDARRDALITGFATRISARGMETPAILFMEMHRPLSFLGSQGIIAFSGFLGPLFGADKIREISQFLAVPGNVELLIQALEQSANQRASANHAAEGAKTP